MLDRVTRATIAVAVRGPYMMSLLMLEGRRPLALLSKYRERVQDLRDELNGVPPSARVAALRKTVLEVLA